VYLISRTTIHHEQVGRLQASGVPRNPRSCVARRAPRGSADARAALHIRAARPTCLEPTHPPADVPRGAAGQLRRRAAHQGRAPAGCVQCPPTSLPPGRWTPRAGPRERGSRVPRVCGLAASWRVGLVGGLWAHSFRVPPRSNRCVCTQWHCIPVPLRGCQPCGRAL
jgi:hypothetical protein